MASWSDEERDAERAEAATATLRALLTMPNTEAPLSRRLRQKLGRASSELSRAKVRSELADLALARAVEEKELARAAEEKCAEVLNNLMLAIEDGR
jgi:hypothetical protein